MNRIATFAFRATNSSSTTGLNALVALGAAHDSFSLRRALPSSPRADHEAFWVVRSVPLHEGTA